MQILIFGQKGSGKSYLVKKKFLKGLKNYIVYDRQKEYNLDIIYSIPEMTERILNNNYPFSVAFGNETDIENSFKLISEIENITIVIDEFHLYMNNSKKVSTLFQNVFLQKHKNQSYILISQRIASIHSNIFSQADYIITFKQILLKDLQTLEKYDIDIERVKNLNSEKFEYLIKKT